MTFLNKFVAFLKAMFAHIHLSLRVKISRKETVMKKKLQNKTEIGGKK